MKIAIDSGPLSSRHSVRGIGVYARELLTALKMDGVDVSKADLSKYDIVHFTSFKPFEVNIPFSKPKGTKFILTIYDLIPLIYPKHYPPGIRGWAKWQTNKYLIKKNIDAIITISETSKKDICRFLGVSPDKVFVTYLAAPAVFQKREIVKRLDTPKRFALYVGGFNYNKNIPNLVKACQIAKTPLVIVSKDGTAIEKSSLDHAELRHLKDIDWSGVDIRSVGDEEVSTLYNMATLYIQPSFYEGFSLPALQAVACETPLAVSKNQCHAEVLGDEFTYFDPNDPKDIADKILNPNINRKLPRTYSWAKTAEETLKVYKNV